MLSGFVMIIISFILVGVLSVWGVKYTRKNIHESRDKKYKVAKILFAAGLVLSISYIIFAKSFSQNIDLVISWLMLATGCFFAAALSFFIGYSNEKD